MHIDRVKISNYRCLKECDVPLNPELNIIVGNNECGKSTFLEAINLALTGQLHGRPIQGELHPHIFDAGAVAEYIERLKAGEAPPPPGILIEIYLADDPALTRLKGNNNSRKEDVPGTKLSIEFNPEYADDLAAYVANPEVMRALPVEYYVARWRSFADNDITSRSIALKPSLIDTATIRNNLAANRYVVELVKDALSPKDQVSLALSYRTMKDQFLAHDKVADINKELAAKKGTISDKTLSVSLDTSSRAGWEAGIMPHLDEIPLTLVGNGEQNRVKIKLALESSAESHLVLIEEPENHLSYAALNELIGHIAQRRGTRQLIITTHSSFVLNKLGIDSVILFSRGKSATLRALTPDTLDYFLKLPGHDTLRLILSSRAILVEGPSDELIVQRAFKMRHGKLPLEDGVDVITVGALAFKRFLDIALLLGRQVAVVTDNDGDVAALGAKYVGYYGKPGINLCYDTDEATKTLEPQLLKANGRNAVNTILGKAFASDDELLKYMHDHKTECALAFFTTASEWKVPDYISRALD